MPGHVSSRSIQRLLNDESIYDTSQSGNGQFGRIYTYVHFFDGFAEERVLQSETDDEAFSRRYFSLMPKPNGWVTNTVVLAVEQKRVYLGRLLTSCLIRLDKGRWIKLLKDYHLLAPALQVLHDNNGGQGAHVSTCKRTGVLACSDPFSTGKPCAYHIYLKLGDWGNDEYFVYLRHDFHTGNNLVLLAGTQCQQHVAELRDRLDGVTGKLDLFAIVLAILSFWHEELERYRWIQDFNAQGIEMQTGHSSRIYSSVKPLAPEQLKLTSEVAMTADNVQGGMTAATNLETLLQFAASQCGTYHELLQSCSASPSSTEPGDDLKEDLSQLSPTQLASALEEVRSRVIAQTVQMRGLQFRVRAQFDIINSLIAQTDSKANIDMASTSLTHSSIMRDVTLVTYLFLPGTFLATFFSMIFFHLNENGDEVVVSKWIWVYFVCVVPLTIGLGWKFARAYLHNLRRVK